MKRQMEAAMYASKQLFRTLQADVSERGHVVRYILSEVMKAYWDDTEPEKLSQLHEVVMKWKEQQ